MLGGGGDAGRRSRWWRWSSRTARPESSLRALAAVTDAAVLVAELAVLIVLAVVACAVTPDGRHQSEQVCTGPGFRLSIYPRPPQRRRFAPWS
jgi:hypothetical protein